MTSSDSRESRKRIFLVDDHPLVREWLGHLINRQTDLTLCGEAGDASEAMREIRRRAPDAVVVDISLGEAPELNSLRKSSWPFRR